MLSPARCRFLSPSRLAPSKRKSASKRTPHSARILSPLHSQNLHPSFLPLRLTPSPPLPQRPRQSRQPPPSPRDPLHHQLLAAQRPSRVRRMDVPAVRDQRTKTRSSRMGTCHPHQRRLPNHQRKSLARDVVPAGLSRKAGSSPWSRSTNRPSPNRTQATCSSLSGRSSHRPHHEMRMQIRNPGLQVPQVDFSRSVSRFLRVLSVPRAGQYTHSGRYGAHILDVVMVDEARWPSVGWM
jgi:hypothetical protein